MVNLRKPYQVYILSNHQTNEKLENQKSRKPQRRPQHTIRYKQNRQKGKDTKSEGKVALSV